MPVNVDCIYSSCAANKTPNAVDWGDNGIICYSSCTAVHLYTYKKSGPCHVETLIGHKNIVTSVHWIKKVDNSNETEFISTSADHTASIWTLTETKFFLSSVLIGHTNVVRNATGLYLTEGQKQDLIVATLSTDSSIKIWTRESNTFTCQQTVSLGSGFGLDVEFATLNGNKDIIMAVATDDSKLHIYVQNKESMFVPTVKLKGHEDWIQNISIVKENSDSLLIATASQDSFIRIWKISLQLNIDTNSEGCDATALTVDTTTFHTASGATYSVTLESVLCCHENWVYSARWRQYRDENKELHLQILSASMDKTIIVWEFDPALNIWVEKVRFGEVGGNTMGFFGAVFSPSGGTIIAHSHHGAIHTWNYNSVEDSWEPGLSLGGHHAPVKDIDWDPDGQYLLSCSSDQTTRLHAPYKNGGSKHKWYEIARPQIHGYDMVSLAVLNRFAFVSAGDEKILRVFQAPRNFAETLGHISKIDTSLYLEKNMAEGASVPSLGLSNKAVRAEDIMNSTVNGEKDAKDRYPDFYYTPVLVTSPPTEETLLQNTLWPEVQKLYGHPYEVFTIASNHSGTVIASACKASKCEHAGIILWSTSTWRQISYLSFHSLTVTQLAFSPDDQYLLSVSRDRMWALYQHCPEDAALYRKVANLDKKNSVHSRIIWSCSWTFDSLYFTTASRDKKVAVWGKSPDSEVTLSSQPLEVDDSATALSIAPCLVKNRYLIAVGSERGSILLCLWCKTDGWDILHELNQNIAHHMNVNRLKFSPKPGQAEAEKEKSSTLQLASCSDDCHTKIYNICMDLLT